jgi:hypothetical protein
MDVPGPAFSAGPVAEDPMFLRNRVGRTPAIPRIRPAHRSLTFDWTAEP